MSKSKKKNKATKVSPAGKGKGGKGARPEKPIDPEADCLGRVPHPITKDESAHPFETAPEDYDPKKHQPFTKKDFAEEHQFLSFKAGLLEEAAAKLRTRAEESKRLGTGEERKARQKLLKLRESFDQLSEKLKEQGVDVDSLLADEDEAGGDAGDTE
jgi:hypothetical protein